jgi:hypothetical protein
MGCKQHQLEAIWNLVDAIFDGNASHWALTFPWLTIGCSLEFGRKRLNGNRFPAPRLTVFDTQSRENQGGAGPDGTWHIGNMEPIKIDFLSQARADRDDC